MKSNKIIIIVTVIVALICFVIVPLGVNYVFRFEASVDIMAARWTAADALTYISTTLAFIGTLFLGLVAWKQNTALQKMEKNNFISENSCEVFLEELSMSGMKSIAFNLDNEHMEAIVVEKNIQECKYGSFKLGVSLKRSKGYASLVKVKDVQIFLGNDNGCIPILAYPYDDTYNRIAILEKHNKFDITVLLKPETKTQVIQKLNNDCSILIDITIELVTPSYVSTEIKCRGKFKKTDSDGLTDTFKLAGTEPMCFWEGNYIRSEDDIKFRINTRK